MSDFSAPPPPPPNAPAKSTSAQSTSQTSAKGGRNQAVARQSEPLPPQSVIDAIAEASLAAARKAEEHKKTREERFARTAWSYFTKTTDETTGFVRSTIKFPSSTMWDQGGYFLAIVSAERLGLIDRAEAVDRGTRAFESLRRMEIMPDGFPNKAYNTETLQMTNYANKPVKGGIGYSALDMMRLISGMLALEEAYPELQIAGQRVRERWNFDILVSDGRYWSTATKDGKTTKPLLEGRIGYEQYAARTGLQIGLDVVQGVMFEPILRWQEHNGLMLPGDNRLARTHGVDPVTTSEPFLLEALEYGWRPELVKVSMALYAAQRQRYFETGYLTSLSEDHIAGKPYFAYGGILVGEKPFQTVAPGGRDANHKRTISTKASFGWWALVGDAYSEELLRAVEDLQTPEGWQAGRFESDGSPNTVVTLNTNAVILQALHYRRFGPLITDKFYWPN